MFTRPLMGLVLLLSSFVFAQPQIDVSSTIGREARAFLTTLSAAEKARAVFPFNSEERFRWFYTPASRKGISLKQMTAEQRKAALNLLRAGLSEKGYTKAETIRKLEDVVRELEGGRGPTRDHDLYYFTFFGEPSDTAPWGWRYEGHHCSQNWTVVNGRSISGLSSSPQFFGANPAEVRSGPMKGTRVLAAEEDLGRALIKSLDAAQRAEALLSADAPDEILTGNDRQAGIQEDKGIAYAKLTTGQQGTLLALMEEYLSAQPQGVARTRLQKIRNAGLDNIKFAWTGGLEPGQGHYYRVQGPSFLIEFDKTQNSANHIHCVWREFNGDWGADLLAEHYRNSPHHHGGDGNQQAKKMPGQR